MKKILLTIFIFVPSALHAGYGKGNHVVSASLGGVVGVNDFNEVKGVGPGGGVAYRYYVSDVFSIGADVALDDYGNHYSEENKTDVDTQLLSTSLVGRLDFWPRKEHASYISLGTGTQYVQQTFHEPTGDRTEKSGRAGIFLALGFEVPLKGRWMWGAELRSTDPLGVSADAIGLKLMLSRRFGKEVASPNKDFD